MTALKIDIIKVIGWIIATVSISITASFGVIKFAYSNFETKSTTEIYRQETDKRLNSIENFLIRLDSKMDKILETNYQLGVKK